MKNVKINHKNMSLKKAKNFLNDEKTVVKHLSIDLSNKKKPSSNEAPSHLGFNIEANLISGLSTLKHKTAARSVILRMEKCPKIDNRNLLIMIYDQPEGWRKWLFSLFLKAF